MKLSSLSCLLQLLSTAHYATALLVIPDTSLFTDTFPSLADPLLRPQTPAHDSTRQSPLKPNTWPVDQRWQIRTYTSPTQYALSASPNQPVDGPLHVYEVDNSAFSQLFYAQPYSVHGTSVVILITMGDMYIGVSPDQKRPTVDYYDEWEMQAVQNEDELEVYRFKPFGGEDKYWTVDAVDGGVITLEEKGAGGCQEWVVRRV